MQHLAGFIECLRHVALVFNRDEKVMGCQAASHPTLRKLFAGAKLFDFFVNFIPRRAGA
jgi:hypothetical protein